MKAAKIIEVIETTLTVRGNGKDTSIRVITQYWSRDGELLAERDPAGEDDALMKGVCQGVGWAHADACEALDRGGDPRKTDCAEQLRRALRDLVEADRE